MKLDNVLLIAGNGRNVGKTSLACNIIQNLLEQDIMPTALKVSNHKHPILSQMDVIIDNPQLFIGRELNSESNKDSNRYLQAGAETSYYAQMKGTKIEYVTDFIHNYISPQKPIIIESALLGQVIEPGLALFVKQGEEGKTCRWEFNYHIIDALEKGNLSSWPDINWINGHWHIDKVL